MERTTVMLPNELKNKAAKQAREQGLSLGELIRKAIENSLNSNTSQPYAQDPFLNDDVVFTGEIPVNLSGSHDAYLYGSKE